MLACALDSVRQRRTLLCYVPARTLNRQFGVGRVRAEPATLPRPQSSSTHHDRGSHKEIRGCLAFPASRKTSPAPIRPDFDLHIVPGGPHTPPKTTKPGWLARLFPCGTGLANLAISPQNVCAAGSPARAAPNLYITNARFSNSYCRTGRAHPAISTRPAASSAALGETP
jgi:hypothetical protein